MSLRLVAAVAALAFCCVSLPVLAGEIVSKPVVIEIGGHGYPSWQDFHERRILASGRKCLTPSPERVEFLPGAQRGDPGDCASNFTNPSPAYAPDEVFLMDVVVHVIRNTSGSQGDVSESLVQSQIDILNEDFLALAGTNGESGNAAAFQFRLASRDPSGNPTNGITYSNNTTWYNDGGSYWNTLAWDPDRYINVYTNQAQGALGYVPWLPQSTGANPGASSDRVVILWSTFGLNAPYGPPYNKGRTLTHEMGHFFGLEHTFNGGCASGSPPDCYMSGDLICDTNSESSPTFGCPTSRNTCSAIPAPFDNYMDYSDDLCMERFTPEQVLRMRCTLANYRASLPRRSRLAVAEPPSRGPPPPAAAAPYHAAPAPVRLESRPNPFRGRTEISFDLPASGPVVLRIMDVAGRTIRTLVRGERGGGFHTIAWDGRSDANAPVAPGVYFYRIETTSGAETRRLIRLK